MSITGSMACALIEGWPRAVFAAIEHPDGTAYLHTSVGTRTWNGQTWTGSGSLGKVTPVKQSSEIAIQDITFSLSGVDATILAGLNDDVRNLNGSAWLLCFNPIDDSVVADPLKIIDSELDYQILEIADDGTATLSIIAHSGFYTLDRGIEEAWTPENQALEYPGDTGCDMIPGLQKQDLKWTPT